MAALWYLRAWWWDFGCWYPCCRSGHLSYLPSRRPFIFYLYLILLPWRNTRHQYFIAYCSTRSLFWVYQRIQEMKNLREKNIFSLWNCNCETRAGKLNNKNIIYLNWFSEFHLIKINKFHHLLMDRGAYLLIMHFESILPHQYLDCGSGYWTAKSKKPNYYSSPADYLQRRKKLTTALWC